MIEAIRAAVSQSLELKRTFFAANEQRIADIARAISEAMERGNKVLLYGNGGSAADSQHIAAEWVGRFRRERRPLPALALGSNTSVLTSLGNDYGFDHIFVRQVEAFGLKGDVAIAISTSGNSPNVLLATEAARELGLITVGLTGCTGGRLGPMVDYHLNVPHSATCRVQEVHIMIGHLLCELVETDLRGI
jgi:D-sedoheptulose 7-phosphate isomerase